MTEQEKKLVALSRWLARRMGVPTPQLGVHECPIGAMAPYVYSVTGDCGHGITETSPFTGESVILLKRGALPGEENVLFHEFAHHYRFNKGLVSQFDRALTGDHGIGFYRTLVEVLQAVNRDPATYTWKYEAAAGGMGKEFAMARGWLR